MSKFSTPFMRKSPLHSHQGPCWDGYVRDHSKDEGEKKSCYKPGEKNK